MSLKQKLSSAIQKGHASVVKDLTHEAILAGVDVKDVLDGLLEGMGVVGQRFKANEIFVPEVLIAARALNGGLDIIKPILTETGIKPIGTVVIGTVKGDLHDIGKNLVKMMLVGAGLEVIDLGVDVPAERFVDEALKHDAKVICLSALLTTTMNHMHDVIAVLNTRGLRDAFIVMVGGAPLNASFCTDIGADYYAADAQTAAEIAKSLFTQ